MLITRVLELNEEESRELFFAAFPYLPLWITATHDNLNLDKTYTQSRKWLLTINNPQDHGMSHNEIIDCAQKFNPYYMCLADEIGEEGTYHTHLFLY